MNTSTHPGSRNDDRDVRESVSDVGESGVALGLHVHLAEVGHPLDVAIVSDEGESPRTDRVAIHPHAAGDRRAEPIGADHEARADVARAERLRAGAHATHRPTRISQY